MECKYAIRIQDFPYRVCKLQQEAPVGCNIIPMYEECQILKEYNIDTSVRHSEMSDNIVRTALNKENAEL